MAQYTFGDPADETVVGDKLLQYYKSDKDGTNRSVNDDVLAKSKLAQDTLEKIGKWAENNPELADYVASHSNYDPHSKLSKIQQLGLHALQDGKFNPPFGDKGRSPEEQAIIQGLGHQGIAESPNSRKKGEHYTTVNVKPSGSTDMGVVMDYSTNPPHRTGVNQGLEGQITVEQVTSGPNAGKVEIHTYPSDGSAPRGYIVSAQDARRALSNYAESKPLLDAIDQMSGPAASNGYHRHAGLKTSSFLDLAHTDLPVQHIGPMEVNAHKVEVKTGSTAKIVADNKRPSLQPTFDA